MENERGDLSARIDSVCDRISVAASRSGRSVAEITLVAVSKTFPRSIVDAAYHAGLSHFAENRVQEAVDKFNGPIPSDLRLHMIGHLQTNKVKPTIQLFDRIDSVDRSSLITALEREANKLDTIVRMLLQVNIAREPQKSGCDTSEAALLLEEILKSSHLRIDGLMTIAPIGATPEDSRPTFCALRELRESLRAQFPGLRLDTLSMGMSSDFEAAVLEGATEVRLGSALFGSRTQTSRISKN